MSSTPRSPHHLALGLAVRELRACQRISQEELGFRTGLHRNYVGAIERGELNPTYGVLLRLCGGLGISLAELVSRGQEAARDRVAAERRSSCPSGRARARTVGRTCGRVRLLPLWNGRLLAGEDAPPTRRARAWPP